MTRTLILAGAYFPARVSFVVLCRVWSGPAVVAACVPHVDRINMRYTRGNHRGATPSTRRVPLGAKRHDELGLGRGRVLLGAPQDFDAFALPGLHGRLTAPPSRARITRGTGSGTCAPTKIRYLVITTSITVACGTAAPAGTCRERWRPRQARDSRGSCQFAPLIGDLMLLPCAPIMAQRRGATGNRRARRPGRSAGRARWSGSCRGAAPAG
jgi:hypothetical protein